ncbi:dipeptidase [Thermanaerothrix sp.]|jgi:acetylornithine deacetylase/succinyl-diaminopimelate desuccinylase-like protein|uniref:dipeptidase n=1 Tax=Thermanaerothrix sp. TaxID=2972675 RepID=UPI002ADDD9D5|nr:dipeptidase [Thermanaerothrix sp.]
MTTNKDQALRYVDANRQAFLNTLKEFASIPSISTDPEHQEDIRRAANWLVYELKRLGFANANIVETAGHPVVLAYTHPHLPEVPTVLIYGHYDVQPPDPYEEWKNSPFEPWQEGDYLYGRGVSDMKGQVMAALKAVEAIIATGSLPLNIIWLIEGEEEIGSPNLSQFLEQYRHLLKADVALNLDTGMIAPDQPTITYGLRGVAAFELRVYGPNRDLHSGLFGGVIHNPAQALCELIAGMHDSSGKVLVPGFYDHVRPLDDEERQELARLPLKEVELAHSLGVPRLYGEPEFSPVERIGARPTLEINGLYSGYTGQGSKTIIPAWAMAKISTRLVPDQDPEDIHQKLRAYLEANCPPTVRWELIALAGSPASITDRHHPGVRALAQALKSVWGKEPLYRREGGSVPVVGMMQRILGLESALSGFGLPDDHIHSPNERLHLPTWYRGIQAVIEFLLSYPEFTRA